MTRCGSCERLILPRWRRCPWCKRWSGQPHMADAEGLEAELHSLALVGAVTSVGVGFFAAAFYDGSPLWFWSLASFAVSLLICSGLLLMFAVAVDLAVLLHAVWLGVAFWAGSSGALLPAFVVAFALVRRRHLRALIKGSPEIHGWKPPTSDLSRCVHCGAPAAGLLSARWVVSAVLMAAMSYNFPRPRCLHHARLAAIPATLVTLVLGWWSPWGLFWTPNALYDNLMFGGIVTEEGTADAEKVSRIGWFRFALPGLAFAAGVFNWLLVGHVLHRLMA